MKSVAIIALVLVAAPASAAARQVGDALNPDPEIEVDMSGGRIDFRISPSIRALEGEPQENTIGLRAGVNLDLVCGKGDLRAYFRSLISKEAREDYVEGVIDMLIGEVLGSTTELICQSSPTACSIFQNNNLAANIKLTYHNDLCRTIEEAVLDGSSRGRAKAIQKCIDRKIAAGKSEDEAIKACRSEEPEIYGFDGRVVAKLNLNDEIRKFVRFSQGGEEVLGAVTDNAEITPKGSSSDPDPNALPRRFDELRSEFKDKWIDAVEAGEGISNEELLSLVPLGTPRVTKQEVLLLAKRPRRERLAFIESVATAAALLALTREINEVERKVEALAASTSVKESEENVAILEGLLERLSGERRRLERLFADQERLNRALAIGHGLALAEIAKARIRAVQGAAIGEKRIKTLSDTRPFGTFSSSVDHRLNTKKKRGSTGSDSCCDGTSGGWGRNR